MANIADKQILKSLFEQYSSEKRAQDDHVMAGCISGVVGVIFLYASIFGLIIYRAWAASWVWAWFLQSQWGEVNLGVFVGASIIPTLLIPASGKNFGGDTHKAWKAVAAHFISATLIWWVIAFPLHLIMG